MNRSIFFFFAAAFASSIPFACTATLDENCISGPCEADQVAASSVASAGAGGSGGAGGGAPVCDPNLPTTGDYPCDVFAVLQNRCFECHTNPPLNGAPFPLLTFEDSHQPYSTKLRWEFMKIDIESGYMPFNKPDDLMGAELKTMEDWFAQCAPPAPAGMGCK